MEDDKKGFTSLYICHFQLTVPRARANSSPRSSLNLGFLTVRSHLFTCANGLVGQVPWGLGLVCSALCDSTKPTRRFKPSVKSGLSLLDTKDGFTPDDWVMWHDGHDSPIFLQPERATIFYQQGHQHASAGKIHGFSSCNIHVICLHYLD
ncbi:hypothetical protein B0H34DRAFT_722731 [Crassisporium funariophilum]|nr:hypothetical protein B0H34DRAFT_722731 [Crassisporium funariophilum]